MTNGDRSLRRSSQDAIFAGVLGGLGEFFGLSATRLRWSFFLLTVLSAGFPGVLVYLALWFVLPERPRDRRDFTVREPE